jgi:hypothetical protein
VVGVSIVHGDGAVGMPTSRIGNAVGVPKLRGDSAVREPIPRGDWSGDWDKFPFVSCSSASMREPLHAGAAGDEEARCESEDAKTVSAGISEDLWNGWAEVLRVESIAQAVDA